MDRAEALALVRSKAEKETTVRHLITVEGVMRRLAVHFGEDPATWGLVGLFHRFEVMAFAWDVQEVRHLREALRMNVDGLYCDRPERMVAIVAEWLSPMIRMVSRAASTSPSRGFATGCFA